MKKFLLIAIACLLVACDFGDTNIDPGRLTDVEARNVLPAALAQSARNVGSIGPRVTGTVIQYFQGVNAQPEGYTTYMLDEGIIDDYWRSGLFGGAMKDCSLIIQKAAEKNMPHYRGIAKVLMAFNLGIATSFWGDVPYSEAFQNKANITPTYDSQSEIYASIQLLLDDALLDFARPAGDFAPSPQDDLVFKGDIGKWAGTARALKARYYMHLTRRDPDASLKALVALSKGALQSNTDQPDFPFEDGDALISASPLSYFAQERADQIVMGSFLANTLVGLSDPRTALYGVKSGDIYEIYDDSNSQLFWAKNESPLPLISYSEVKFIEAEAYLRLGNDLKAASSLAAAITANMTKIGASNYASYVTTNSSLTGTFEEKLEKVMTQKYLAMYGQGTIEAWVDYRRTGYPKIPLPAGVQVRSDFFANSIPIIPRRYLYPQSERNTNGINWQEAIDRQGGHFLDNDMWAFKN